MARTTQQYYEIIRQEAINRATEVSNQLAIDMLNSTSRVAIWKILFWAAAFCAFLVDSLYDLFRAEIDEKVKNYSHPALPWFATTVKAFQFGDDLVAEKDYYDNTLLTADEVEERKVVKYAAAANQFFENGQYGVRIKVAGENGAGERIALPEVQMTAISSYWERVGPGGVYTMITTDDADYLKLSLRVYYNPLVMNGLGQRLDGTGNDPLQMAINDHLKNLNFNGKFNLTRLVDIMQQVDGIDNPVIVSAQTKRGNLEYTEVYDEVVPDAGYLKIYDPSTDLIIQWIATGV